MANLKQCSGCKYGTLSEETLPFTFRVLRKGLNKDVDENFIVVV